MRPRHIFLSIMCWCVLGLSLGAIGLITSFVNVHAAAPILAAGAIIGISGITMAAIFMLLTEIFDLDLR